MLWLLGIVALFGVLAAPWLAIARVGALERELRRLRERVDELERAGGAALAPVPNLDETPEAASLPEPIPITSIPPSAPAAPEPPLPPAAVETLVRPLPPPSHAESTMEQLVGGIWLQNVGSVLLLLGVFFLIVWGYTTGALGPDVLVAAGVVLGAGFAWRGDRTARTLPAFGHALVGIGLGIVYLSIYLGHFTLHAIDRVPAFALVTLVSFAAVLAGLRYRAEPIALLGVLGAFIPQLVATWLPLRGFALPNAGLLAYFAGVDAAVFVLAARSGWSRLDLAALLLTAITWIANHGAPWTWGVELALAALFVLLGLAPVPRLVRREMPIRAGDLAVVAIAPLALIAASWPFLAYVERSGAAALLLAFAAVYLGAAWWVDTRRPERDLWRPLTFAASLFVTASVERALGLERVAVGWCAEGAVLVMLGIAPRAGWLRACGYAVLALGSFAVLVTIGYEAAWTPRDLPVFEPTALRNLLAIVALAVVAERLARARDRLTSGEARVPELIAWVASMLMLAWIGREAGHTARALADSGGRWAKPPDVGGPTVHARVETLGAVLTSAGWTVLAASLLVYGWIRRSAFLRWLGLAILGLTVLKLLVLDLQQVDPFWRFLTAIAIGAVLLAISYAYQHRSRGRESTQRAPE